MFLLQKFFEICNYFVSPRPKAFLLTMVLLLMPKSVSGIGYDSAEIEVAVMEIPV